MDKDLFNSELKKSYEVLKNGGTLLYPTDTVWGIGCDALNVEAVNKIYGIKKRDPKKPFILLVDTIKHLKNYVAIPLIALPYIISKNHPTTIIYTKVRNLPQNILAEDGSIGIRLVKNEFCKKLIQRLGSPLVSTSANFSGEPTATTYPEISEKLKQRIDYCVSPNIEDETKPKTSSRIFKVVDNKKLVRLR